MTQRIAKAEQFKGEVYQYEYEFVNAVGRLGTSVSSADWSTEDTSLITISGEALSSNVASCLITATNTGCAVVKLTATLADTQKIVRFIELTIDDVKSCC